MIIESKNLHYSNMVYIKHSRSDVDGDVFSSVCKCIGSWLYKKASRYATRKYATLTETEFCELVIGGSSREYPRMVFKSVANPGATQWALHMVEEDSGHHEHRMWNTYVAVTMVSEEVCSLSIEIVNVDDGSDFANPDPSIPNFLKVIVSCGQFVVSADERFFSNYSAAYICLNTPSALDALSAIIRSDNRNVPLAVFYGSRVEISAKRFLQGVLAKALVIWIDERSVLPEDVLHSLGGDCEVRKNQFRLFYPPRLTGNDMRLNRWYYPLDNKFKYQEKTIIRELLTVSVTGGVSSSYIYSQIRRENHQNHLQQLQKEAAAALKNGEPVLQLSKFLPKTPEVYEEIISEKNSKIAELEKEAEANRNYIKEWEDEEKVWQSKEKQYQAKIDEYARQMLSVEAEREYMTEERKKNEQNKSAVDYIENNILPSMSPHQILAYYGMRYQDKIYIHSDAHRSASKANFEDGSEICKIMDVLVGDVYDAFIRKIAKVTELEARTGYYVAMAESSQTNNSNRMKAQRKKDYKGKIIDCSHHMKCDKNGKYFRVYFGIIKEENKIIIGHFGDHLETAGTARRGER